jgi:RimJ/RimL family protein N-acetyltransferase
VGAAGMNREARAKRAHIAWVWGVYVTPAWRGRGAARGLIAATVDTARGWTGVDRVQLSVSADSHTARRVYESAGFSAWGTEPDALRTGGRSYDEVHLSLTLPARA